MDIIVIGAGVTGVTTAWELADQGHAVTVLDAAPGPGRGASFANGSQISPSESVPWASPHNLRLALEWMWQKDSPFRLRLTADPRQWVWLARFLANCRTSAWERNAARMVELALFSQRRLGEIRERTGLAYDREDRGILRIFRTKDQLHKSLPAITAMQRFGVAMSPVEPDGIGELEPALLPAIRRKEIAGGILAPGDETGDAAKFTAAMADEASRMGVRFLWNTECRRIVVHGDHFQGIDTTADYIPAEALVICGGLGSPEITRRLGFDLPIYPLKGYSVTRKLAVSAEGPHISVTDEHRRMVVSRLGDRIRAAGKADLIGYSRDLEQHRANSLLADLDRIYPELEYGGEPEFWTELRPMTPSGIPLIGPSGVRGIWLNTGHGSLGWTMACGSAAMIAELMRGRAPEVAATTGAA